MHSNSNVLGNTRPSEIILEEEPNNTATENTTFYRILSEIPEQNYHQKEKSKKFKPAILRRNSKAEEVIDAGNNDLKTYNATTLLLANKAQKILLECSYCSQEFQTQSELDTHKRTHAGDKPFSCSYCDHKSTSAGRLKSHERVHTGEPLSCSQCDKTFIASHLLRLHEKTHIISCSQCGKRFQSSSSLKVHSCRDKQKPRYSKK